jgi:putative ABC transport system substrate-binding protein
LPALAADLINRQVAAIVTPGARNVLAAKAATSTIPIVFTTGFDPVQSGIVASFNRPRSNITGIAFLTTELAGKRLELLHELLPTAAVVALLVNPTNTGNSEGETRSVQDAARALGLRAPILRASTPTEIDAAFGAIVEHRAEGLIVSGDPFFTNRRNQIIALAASQAVPVVYNYHEFVAGGGLMSYGADLAEGYRQLGISTAKILKGANPADLPVQQIVKLELVINLKTARALGIEIPPIVLARADEVIE